MLNRINRRLRNSLLPGLLLVALVWVAVPIAQGEVTVGASSGNLTGGTFTPTQNFVTSPPVTPSASAVSGNATFPAAKTNLSVPVPAAAANVQALPRYSNGGALYEPTALAIDASGNVWVASYTGGVYEFSPTGELLSPTTGYPGTNLNESYGLTIDINNNIWITSEETPSPSINSGDGTITELNASGTVISPANGYSGGGIFFPVAVASDTLGRIWVADDSHSATLLSNSGGAISGSSGYASSGQLGFPVAVAVDGNNNAWVANFSPSSGNNIDQVVQIAPNGNVLAQVLCCNATSGLAVDQSGNVWLADWYSNKMSEVSGTGTVLSTGYTGGGLDHPYGVAIDGNGNVWTANYLGNSITELQGANGSAPGSALSPATGFGTNAGLSLPISVAIDASGNAWVSSYETNTITEFIGAAAPVQTPLVGPARLP
jgi:sugar lactone lactonase YvrE